MNNQPSPQSKQNYSVPVVKKQRLVGKCIWIDIGPGISVGIWWKIVIITVIRLQYLLDDRWTLNNDLVPVGRKDFRMRGQGTLKQKISTVFSAHCNCKSINKT